MQPFKVTLRFAAPVLRDSEYPIHLDGLIAFSMMKELESIGDENPWRSSDDLSSVLEKAGDGEWVWKASALYFNPASARFFCNMIRKSEPEQYFEDLSSGFWKGSRDSVEYGINPDTYRIDTRSGQQRGYQLLTAFQWMESAVAWGVGDIEVVTDYLSRIEYIGKKGSNGFGQVSEVIVELAKDDEVENWKLRILPSAIEGKHGVCYEPVQACLRAPYWKKINRIIAKEPVM